MAQEFVVLLCCQCRTYQGCQSKKATKWLCKVCGTKQSVKEFFGRGSAKDCRLVVQSLNSGRQQDTGAGDGGRHELMDTTSGANGVDYKILDYLYQSDDNSDAIDDASIPKKQRLTEAEDESKSAANETPIRWTTANQLFSRGVRKWGHCVN